MNLTANVGTETGFRGKSVDRLHVGVHVAGLGVEDAGGDPLEISFCCPSHAGRMWGGDLDAILLWARLSWLDFQEVLRYLWSYDACSSME